MIFSDGGLQPKNPNKPKKPFPNLKFAAAFGFFRFFRCYSVFFSVFFGFLWYFFCLNFDKKFQPFKNGVNNEALGHTNANKALRMSHKSYHNQQEPLNKNPLNQSKLTKMK